MPHKMNSRGDLPGPGDCQEPDYSRADALADQVEAMIPDVLDEWMRDPLLVSEYACTITDETWIAFDTAMAQGHDEAACRIYRAAVRSEMESDAEKEACKRVGAINAQRVYDAAEAKAEQMGLV